MIVRVFEVLTLPALAAAKSAGGIVVVVLRTGLTRDRQRELVEELLLPEELQAYDAERTG